MAIVYGRSGLVPPDYSLYRNPGVNNDTEEFARRQLDDLFKYEMKDAPAMPPYGQPRNEQENIKYRDKYSVPTKPTINDPSGAYAQVRDRLDDENNAAAYTAFMHGRNADSDKASNARYQELLAKRDELKAKIQKLAADIAYQEKLRAIEMKNDPMWDIAKQQYILKGDSSGLENIMSRMEAEKGRDVTREATLLGKSSEKVEKIEAYKKNLRNKVKLANFIYREYPNNDPQSRAQRFNAYMDVMNAAEDLKLKDEDIAKLLPPEVYKDLSAVYNSKPVESVGSATFTNTNDLTTSVENDINNKDFDKALADIEQNKSLFVGGDTDTALTALRQKVEIAKKNSATAAAKTAKIEAEAEKDRQARDEIQRINNMPRGQAKTDAMDQFFVDHPNYIDNVDKDGKWDPKKKESKKK